MEHKTETMTLPVEGLPQEGHYLVNGACQDGDRLYVGLTSFSGRSRQRGTAHLLQYDLGQEAWATLLSRELPGMAGAAVRTGSFDEPVAGFGAFGVFPRQGSEKPLIWASPYTSPQPLLLVSGKGGEFMEVDFSASQGGPPPSCYDLKYLGDLWAAIPVYSSSASGSNRAVEGEPVMFLGNDPAGAWHSHSLPPDVHGSGIVQGGVVFSGLLYLAVADAEGGFQLWKTDPRQENDWVCILDRGAGRYVRNQGIWQMTLFQDALYLSTGPACKTGYGPRDGAEIIRLTADDRWELIVGEPRFSTMGLQIPYAVMGPGFDEDGQVMIPGLASFEDRLWALSQVPLAEEGPGSASGEPWRMDLWTTADGEEWVKEGQGELLDRDCGGWPRSLCPAGPGLLLTGLFSASDRERPELRFLKTAGT